MVTFSHPIDWVVTYPSNDVNGEDGTIQAGEYAKGDTATLFVYNEPGHVEVRIMAKLVKLLICVHANLAHHLFRTLTSKTRRFSRMPSSKRSPKREITCTKISR
jgi:hypothetical protein